MNDTSLLDLRKEIDEIDSKLVLLLTKRMDLSSKVAEIKKRTNTPVLNQKREDEIIQSVSQNAGDYGQYIASLYRTLMDVSRELQHNQLSGGIEPCGLAKNIRNAMPAASAEFSGTLACQGVPGSFSSHAAKLLYPNALLVFYKDFEEVFIAVESGSAEYGIVPVENSIAGAVTENYDSLMKYRLYITSGISMSVTQNLLGLPGAALVDIKTVYSHEKALGQSQAFIKEHGLKAVPYVNTAAAAKFVADTGDISIGAIGSKEAADLYGLSVICKGIQSDQDNRTRFAVISKTLQINKNSNKFSLAFSLPHVTGSLYRVLGRLATHGLNLTKIESRALESGKFNYLFYLDLTGDAQDQDTLALLSELSDELPDFAFLGSYRENDN